MGTNMKEQMQDIRNMTSKEVYSLIFKDKEPWEHVSMPEWIAEQVLEMDHFERSLKDWAWQTVSSQMA